MCAQSLLSGDKGIQALIAMTIQAWQTPTPAFDRAVCQAITVFCVFLLLGLFPTATNALNEKTATQTDIMGRVKNVEVRDSGNSLVRKTSYSYSPDHNSVTTTSGTGADAIASRVPRVMLIT